MVDRVHRGLQGAVAMLATLGLLALLPGTAAAACPTDPDVDDFTEHTYSVFAGSIGSFASRLVERTFAQPISEICVTIVAGDADDIGYVGSLQVTDVKPQCSGVGRVQAPVDVTSQVLVEGDRASLILRAQENCCCRTGWGSATQGDRLNARLHWQVSFGGSELKVECTPTSVTRGDTVRCEASVDGGGAGTQLAVTRWSFAGGGLTTEEASTATFWEGPAVIGGTVTVEATVDGAAASASDTISVAARDWSGRTAHITVTNPAANDLPARPTRVGELGHIHQERAGIAGLGGVGPLAIEQVMTGPNRDFFYLIEVPVVAELIVHVNQTALTVGSDFWRRQPNSTSSSSGRCDRSQVAPFLPLVRAHEGANFETNSHAQLYRDEVNRQVGPAMEDLVTGPDLSAILNQAEQRWLPIKAAAEAESARADSQFPVPYCSFRFF